jgi:2-oxoglutarate dehydrogenase E1 component
MPQPSNEAAAPEPDSADPAQQPGGTGSQDFRNRASSPVVDVVGGNAQYIAELYDQYLADPASVGADWQAFFAGFALGLGGATPPRTVPDFRGSQGEMPQDAIEQATPIGIFDLVHTFREFGHFEASLNPLARELGEKRKPHPMLSLENFGLHDQPGDLYIGIGGFRGPCDGTLGDLVSKLRNTYCRNIGVEFTAIADKEQRDWLADQMEPVLNRPELSPDQKKHILRQLIAAEEFEQYLHRAFVGSKRFSIEGAEALVPLLNTIVEMSGDLGGEQVICAMAHRGRLNVLAHVMAKPYETMLAEFAGTIVHDESLYGDGDVKYHLGFSNQRVVKVDAGGQQYSIKVSLLPNPSHLELINPIQQGIIRCKQQWLMDGNRRKVVPITLHGDAAFCGQGIVFETLNLSELPGYRTGGTIHTIVNNQIGFTTPPAQGRFTPYPTDVAKAIQAPVFHVNGDDPEAVWHVGRLAIGFRQRFRQDVMIDVWCYRKYGHNEQDEPSFTQPLMYKAIKDHPSVREIYAQRLLSEGVVTSEELEQMKQAILDRLKVAREEAAVEKPRGKVPTFSGVWRGFGRAPDDYRQWQADTSVGREPLERVVASLQNIPKSFTVHPKLNKLLESRVSSVRTGEGIDWGTAEMLALGSLLLEGTNVRFTGQDVERGTFSHRQAVLHDYNTGEKYRPLQYVGGGAKHERQGRFEIINSMLSEEAVLGFDWGFASADPRNLVIWEAQFGDFVNGAQNIIDQILAAAESKWRYTNGMVLHLPHGYEGQGPEHSNGYLERFLSLCAENNMQVACPSTPAQHFHLLRRQVLRKFRKPLVLMMPKSLLRKPEASSRIEEFTSGSLQLVIDDAAVQQPERVRRVLLCSGKIYFTLDAARRDKGRQDVAIVRVEQLYPFPEHEIRAVIERYHKAAEIFWTQEESRNRGAWTFMQPRLREMFPDRLIDYRGRDDSASPATGSLKVHAQEEQKLVEEALELSLRSVAATT